MEERAMILAGEIGATRTRLAAFDTEANRLKCVVENNYPSQEHNSLAEILPQFTRTEGIPVHSACFGVAGPVRNGRSKISNLPWTIDAKELATQLKLPTVGLLNDLEAYAYGIDALESKDFISISPGSENAEGNRAVMAGPQVGTPEKLARTEWKPWTKRIPHCVYPALPRRPEQWTKDLGKDVRVLMRIKVRDDDPGRLDLLNLRLGLGFDFGSLHTSGKGSCGKRLQSVAEPSRICNRGDCGRI
jgi:hypothetical protein